MEKIVDFGEPLEGAKKDIVKFRKKGGISLKDIYGWDAEKRDEFITKRDVFPTPSYQQMYDSGEYSREALFFIKKVRDSLANRPNLEDVERQAFLDPESDALKEKIRIMQDNYVKNLNYVRDILYEVKTEEDIFETSKTISAFCKEKSSSREERGFITKRIHKTLELGSKWGYKRFLAEMKDSKFLYSENERLLAEFTLGQFHKGDIEMGKTPDGDNVLSIRYNWGKAFYYRVAEKYMDFHNWKEGTYFVVRNGKRERTIEGFNFRDKKEAEKFILDSFSQKEVKAEKGTSASVKKPFTVKKLPKIERIGKDVLNGENISGDKLMEEFGFRAGQFGESYSQTKRQEALNMTYEAFKDMAIVLGIEDDGVSLDKKLALSFGARGSSSAVQFEPKSKIINLSKDTGAGMLGYAWAKAFDCFVAEKLGSNSVAESSRGKKGMFSNVMYVMKYYDGGTKFYKDAQAMDKLYAKNGSDCWASNKELFARAFQAYLFEKLSPGKNDFLCGQVETQEFEYNGEKCYPFPVGREREHIVKAFDDLFSYCKDRGFFEMRGSRPKPVKETTYSIISKEAVNYFDSFFKNDEAEKAASFIYDLVEAIEINDNLCNVETKDLVSGAFCLEEYGDLYMHDIKETLRDNLESTLKTCQRLGIETSAKMRFFKQVKDLIRTDFRQMNVFTTRKQGYELIHQ